MVSKALKFGFGLSPAFLRMRLVAVLEHTAKRLSGRRLRNLEIDVFMLRVCIIRIEIDPDSPNR